MRRKVLARRSDERGAILVMSAVGLVLAVVAAALAVDLGRMAQERRRDQKVADMAALDAVRDLANTLALARASADRNQFPWNNGPGGFNLQTAVGSLDSTGTFVAGVGASAVQVTVTSRIKNAFQPGQPIIVAKAVASRKEEAGFTIGSSLASANLDTELPIMNAVFSRLLGASGNVNLVSYQGLASANVKLRDLQAALGVGSLNELLTTNLTIKRLLDATATVLNNQGTVASADAATKVAQLSTATNSTATFKLGDYIQVAQGSENKALDGDVNVLQLITAGAELANKNNFIDAGSVLTVPNPTGGTAVSTSLGLKVIEGPKLYVGPVGGTRHTAQVQLTLTPHLDIGFNAAGLLGALVPLRLVGDVPVLYSAAGADGTLTAIRCANPNQGITVGVTTQPITTSTSAILNVYSPSALLNAANVRAAVDVHPTAVSTSPGGPYTEDFAWSGEFTPPGTGKTTPGAPLGLSLGTSNGSVSVTAGILGLPVGVTTSAVATAVVNPILIPILSSVASRVSTPALKALGVAIGPVDVTAPAAYFDPANCGQPGLVA